MSCSVNVKDSIMSSNSDDRLNWLATQYVLGELCDSDRDAFELRLAEDLTACEAVARATRLTRALHAALEDSDGSAQLPRAPFREPRRSRFAVVTLVAAISCLFLVMIFWSGNSVDFTESGLTQRSNLEAVEFGFQVAGRMRKPAFDDDADDTDDDVHENSVDIAVPGWLMAGVVLEKHGELDLLPEESQDN